LNGVVSEEKVFQIKRRGVFSRPAVHAGILVLAVAFAVGHLGGQSSLAAPSTISPQQLSPYMRAHVTALGDRLVKPGNERVTLAGTLSGATPAPINVTYEISGKLRVDLGGRSVGFDGNATWNGTGPTAISSLATNDFELIETLLNDSAEYFFAAQAQHVPTRPYGLAFRFDDGKAKNYAGPYYDVFEVLDSVPGSKQRQARIYCINARTFVLERVQQDTVRAGKKVRIETVLGGWQSFGTEKFPTSITRTQDGQQVLALKVTSATTGPALTDGILTAPKP
jgi:hypothetical protein